MNFSGGFCTRPLGIKIKKVQEAFSKSLRLNQQGQEVSVKPPLSRQSLKLVKGFSIQKTVDERTEQGWSVLSARIVEKQPWARNRPVREDLN